MFPGAHAEIIKNEAGEPVAWDDHYHDEPEYCDVCGSNHSGPCDEYEWDVD
jgi:hypothetical protein